MGALVVVALAWLAVVDALVDGKLLGKEAGIGSTIVVPGKTNVAVDLKLGS